MPYIHAQGQYGLSTPPQERALPLPTVWATERLRAASKSPPAQPSRFPTDEDLLFRLQVNDIAAFDLLFARYCRLVLGIALRILNDHGEAEDVVQETFLYLLQKAVLFDPAKGTARSWIVQVAFHKSFDRRKYLRRRSFFLGTSIGSLDDTLLGETDLDREIGSKLNGSRLKEAFAELSEMQRRTLELYFFEGLELREIAEKLGEPLGNIRHHCYRGLKRLRRSAFIERLREK
jgi:RNA polymerase sigma-70 factor, ECF subfamily